MILLAPNGLEIDRTLETIPGSCMIIEGTFRREEDGKIGFDWAGETDVFWDDQRTVERNDQRVFLDTDGNEWLEDQLQLVDEAEVDNVRLKQIIDWLLGAGAFIVDDSPLLNSVDTSPIERDNGGNEVVRFSWVDDEGYNFSTTFTQEGLLAGSWRDSHTFVAPDHEGETSQIKAFRLRPFAVGGAPAQP